MGEYLDQWLGMMTEVAGQQNTNLTKIEDCKYTCIDDYLLKHGRDGKAGQLSDDALLFIDSLKLAKYQLRECYYNAYDIAQLGRFSSVNVKYMEGLATTGLIATSHAWNEIDGIVVDLTYGPLQHVTMKSGVKYMRRKDRIIGTIPDGYEYIGVEIPLLAVENCIIEHGAHFPVIDDWCHKYPWLTTH